MAAILDTDNETNLHLSQILENLKSFLAATFKVNLSKSVDTVTRLGHYSKFESVLTSEEKTYISSYKSLNIRSIIVKLHGSIKSKLIVGEGGGGVQKYSKT